MRFVDTNVLVYSVSADEPTKATVARRLLREADLALSAQVLQEFYVVVTSPRRSDPLAHRDAIEIITALRRFPVADIADELVLAAAATGDRVQISYRDAAILEAARLPGCDLVLSEDLSDEQDYDGIRVENPFSGR